MSENISNFTFEYEADLDMIRVSSDSISLLSMLTDVFTVSNPSYFYLSQKGINVDKDISVISPLGAFQVGLFPIVYSAALKIVGNDKSRIIVSDENKIILQQKCFPLKGLFSNEYDITNLNEDKPLRWYQREAVKALLLHGRGIVLSSTGSGKSLMIATLVNELRKNNYPKMEDKQYILLLVPTRQLVDQMAKDFDDYGLGDYSTYTSNSGSKKDNTYKDNSCSNGFNNLIITNHSWIREKYKNSNFPISKIGCIIADEVHTVSKAPQILKVIKKIKSILKFGFTATLPDFIYQKWINFGIFGVPLFKIDIKELQNEGYLSKLEIYPIHGIIKNLDKRLPFSLSQSRAKLNDILDDGTVVDIGTAYIKELEYIETNCKKIWMPIFNEISNQFDFEHKNIVVLFDRITIGKTLLQELREKYKNINICYIDGNIDVSLREEIRNNLENSNGNILIAQSVTASVGLNIKNLHGIVFAFSGRSYVKILQSIGRVIRQKKDKKTAKLFEVWFNLKYSSKHHYEKQEIFSENYGKDCIKTIKTIDILC